MMHRVKGYGAGAVLLLSGLLAAACFAPRPAAAAGFLPDGEYEYVETFDDVESVEAHFDAYYVDVTPGHSSVGEEIAASAAEEDGHWYLEGGAIRRRGDIDGAADTNRIAVLTYTKDVFSNFELSVDYVQGQQTFWWPVVGFRQAEEGKYSVEDGAGVFVQQEGMMTLWGAPPTAGPHNLLQIPNYDRGAVHTLVLTVQNQSLTLSVDGNEATFSLSADFYQDGFVSLISVNNDTVFDNFKIKRLAELPVEEKPRPEPVPDAGTADSLDTLAGEIKDGPLVEREKVSQQSAGGCSARPSAGAALSVGAALAGAVGLARRRLR